MKSKIVNATLALVATTAFGFCVYVLISDLIKSIA